MWVLKEYGQAGCLDTGVSSMQSFKDSHFFMVFGKHSHDFKLYRHLLDCRQTEERMEQVLNFKMLQTKVGIFFVQICTICKGTDSTYFKFWEIHIPCYTTQLCCYSVKATIDNV